MRRINNVGEKRFVYSALISVFYKEKSSFLIKSLDSILKQTVLPKEIILIEDGKFPIKLNDVVENFKKNCSLNNVELITIKHTKAKGLATSLNEGIAKTTTNFIARFDSDDISVADRIKVQSVIFKDENVSVVGSYVKEFSDEMSKEALKKVPLNYDEIKKYSKKRNPMNHMSVIFRKSDILEVGGYEKVPFFEDYLLWSRVIMANHILVNIPMVLVYARTESDFVGRRSGLKYAAREFDLQGRLFRIGLISRFELVRNIALRSTVRLFPKKILNKVYSRLRERES